MARLHRKRSIRAHVSSRVEKLSAKTGKLVRNLLTPETFRQIFPRPALNTSAVRFGIGLEALEIRQHLSAVAAPSLYYGTLSFGGLDSQPNKMTAVLSSDGKSVIATEDGASNTFPLSQISLIKVFGTANNDYVSIDPSITVPELIDGKAGDDTVYAGGGPVTLHGSAGNDLLVGGPGVDSIYGDDGNDTILGGVSGDNLNGNNGNDSINGGSGDDVIDGGTGQNTIIGGGGDDIITNAVNLPSVDVYTVTPLQAVISNYYSTTIMAGETVQVNAIKSGIGVGDPLTTQFNWFFGDTTTVSRYDTLNGFNAAHVYDRPGNYTICLTVTNSAGQVSKAYEAITVLPDTRKALYVAANGSDSNSGLSANSPIKTLAEAQKLLTADTEILFRRGDTFGETAGFNVDAPDVLLGAYGTGASPIIKWTGARAGGNMITTVYPASNVTIQDLTFDSIYNTDTAQSGMAEAVFSASYNTTVRRCTFLNVGYAVNSTSRGLLVEDNTAPVQKDLRGYFVWMSGADVVILGNKVAGSANEHIVRGGPLRALIAYNDFANPATVAGSQGKGCIVIQGGAYTYISNNIVENTGGGAGVGPLPGQSATPSASWVVWDSNSLGSYFDVAPGAHHVLVSNNIFPRTNGTAITINGFSAADNNRIATDIRIINNTDMGTGQWGNFLSLFSKANGITLDNNLWVEPGVQWGNYRATALYVNGADLSSFTEIQDNVWPVGTLTKGIVGPFYVGLGINDFGAYETLSTWLANAIVSGDVQHNGTIGTNQVTINGFTAGAAI